MKHFRNTTLTYYVKASYFVYFRHLTANDNTRRVGAATPCAFVLEAPKEVHRYSSEDNCQRLRSKLPWPSRSDTGQGRLGFASIHLNHAEGVFLPRLLCSFQSSDHWASGEVRIPPTNTVSARRKDVRRREALSRQAIARRGAAISGNASTVSAHATFERLTAKP
jgi:hypothetical protein